MVLKKLMELKFKELKTELEERDEEPAGRKSVLQEQLREVLIRENLDPNTYEFEIQNDIQQLKEILMETSTKSEENYRKLIELASTLNEKLLEKLNSRTLKKELEEKSEIKVSAEKLVEGSKSLKEEVITSRLPEENSRKVVEKLMEDSKALEKDLIEGSRTLKEGFMEKSKLSEEKLIETSRLSEENSRKVEEKLMEDSGALEKKLIETARKSEENSGMLEEELMKSCRTSERGIEGRLDDDEQYRSDNTVVAGLRDERDKTTIEKQQERERLTCEMETVNQRIDELKKQIGLPTASEPSNRSGCLERSGTETLTANIKPMTGHWNTKQQFVYTATVRSTNLIIVPIRQVDVPTTQQATISMSSGKGPPSAAESTQDIETYTEKQKPIMQKQQRAVALVLPRVEQQYSSFQTCNMEQTSVATVASSQKVSNSNTVTTTQAEHKQPREIEVDYSTGGQNDDASKVQQQTVRREHSQVDVTESRVEVEFQVLTSSQRDQEDAVIILSKDEGDGSDEGKRGDEENEEEEMMEADDNASFEENGDGYDDGCKMEALACEPEKEVYDDANCHEMEDFKHAGDTDDSSTKAPNQSGLSSSVSAAPEQSRGNGLNDESRTNERDNASGVTAQTQSSASQSEAISSGSEEIDDGDIVQSRPTRCIPRENYEFGEAVSSFHVPSGRFIFSRTDSAGIVQASESLDGIRADQPRNFVWLCSP